MERLCWTGVWTWILVCAQAALVLGSVLAASAEVAGSGGNNPPPVSADDSRSAVRVSGQPPPPEPEEPGPADPGRVLDLKTLGDGPPYLTYKTPFEFHLTLITAGLGIFMMLALMVMAWRTGISDGFVKTFMVVTIVFGALFLVVAGYSDEQTAPVFGLLGTIVGYIFGRFGEGAVASPNNSGRKSTDADAPDPAAANQGDGNPPATPAP